MEIERGGAMYRSPEAWRIRTICFLLDHSYSSGYWLLSRNLSPAIKARVKRLLHWDEFVDGAAHPSPLARSPTSGVNESTATNEIVPTRGGDADSVERTSGEPGLVAGRNLLIILPSLHIGGVQSLTASIADALGRRDDVTVTIVATNPHPLGRLDQFNNATTNIIELPPNRTEENAVDHVLQIVTRLHVDTIISAVSHEGMTVLRRCKAVMPHIRTIHWLHNDHERCPFLLGSIEWSEAIDLHVAVSENIRRRLMASGRVRPERAAFIPSGVDATRALDPERFNREQCHSAFGLSEKGKSIAYIGRVSAEKGPLNFVSSAAALARRNEVGFVLAGTGDLLRLVRARAEQLGVANRIIYTGALSSLEVARLLRAIDILAVPSIRDAGPLVILEAMSMQVPVVANDVGSVRDMVLDGETGFVVRPHDLRAFTERLERLINDERLRRSMAEAGRKHLLQSPHLLDTMVRRYENILGIT